MEKQEARAKARAEAAQREAELALQRQQEAMQEMSYMDEYAEDNGTGQIEAGAATGSMTGPMAGAATGPMASSDTGGLNTDMFKKN